MTKNKILLTAAMLLMAATSAVATVEAEGKSSAMSPSTSQEVVMAEFETTEMVTTVVVEVETTTQETTTQEATTEEVTTEETTQETEKITTQEETEMQATATPVYSTLEKETTVKPVQETKKKAKKQSKSKTTEKANNMPESSFNINFGDMAMSSEEKGGTKAYYEDGNLIVTTDYGNGKVVSGCSPR